MGSEELYMDMEPSEKSTTISGGVPHGADEELYMDMAHEGNEATEELYTEGAGESPSNLYNINGARSVLFPSAIFILFTLLNVTTST